MPRPSLENRSQHLIRFAASRVETGAPPYRETSLLPVINETLEVDPQRDRPVVLDHGRRLVPAADPHLCAEA